GPASGPAPGTRPRGPRAPPAAPNRPPASPAVASRPPVASLVTRPTVAPTSLLLSENVIIVSRVAHAPVTGTIVIEVDGRTGTAEHRPGTTILQTARQLGLDPPYSCEAGNCATCMARLVEG